MRRLESIFGPFSLATGALGLIALVASALLYVLLPEIRDASRTLFGISLVLVVLFILGSFEDVKRFIAARQARYGTNTIVMVLAFLGIAVAVNFIAANNHKRFDVTASKQFTLARQTISVLEGMKEPVKAVGFFPSDPASQASRTSAENLLKEYAFHTDKLAYEFVDPDEKPAVARQYEVRDYGAIVFESGSHRKQVFGIGEQDFTGAILNVTGKEQKKVYFLDGHGEHDLDSSDGRGFRLAKEGLQADNYAIRTVNLSTEPQVPKDAAVLIIAGPQKEILDKEVGPLEDYLLNGGKALFMVDPNLPQAWRNILAKWGLKIDDGYVVDQISFAVPDIATPAAQARFGQYSFTQITKDLATTFFPGTTSIKVDIPKDDLDRISATTMIQSSPQSWQEKGSGEPSFNASEDQRGPLSLAVTVEASAPIGGRPRPSGSTTAAGPGGKQSEQTRFVVFGDSDFASNDIFYSLGNSDLFLNTVNWLAAQEELISIRPKPPEFRTIDVTIREWNWVLYSSIFFLPAAVLMVGGVVWWRRR